MHQYNEFAGDAEVNTPGKIFVVVNLLKQVLFLLKGTDLKMFKEYPAAKTLEQYVLIGTYSDPR